ncbi:MAG: hypothetical protein ACLTB5_14570 [Acutalibacteraceae bacterium]
MTRFIVHLIEKEFDCLAGHSNASLSFDGGVLKPVWRFDAVHCRSV